MEGKALYLIGKLSFQPFYSLAFRREVIFKVAKFKEESLVIMKEGEKCILKVCPRKDLNSSLLHSGKARAMTNTLSLGHYY